MNKIEMLMISCMILISGCVSTQKSPYATEISPNASELVVDFSWAGTKVCGFLSPEITVTNIPAGTMFLEVTLKDLDVIGVNHGGGRIENNGSGIIPAGALTDRYMGPCPPPDRSHSYQFTVNAVNGEGIIIGTGKSARGFH